MKQKTNTENIPLSVSVPDDAVCLLWLSADMHLSTSGFACAGGIYCSFPELPGLHPGHPRAIPFQCIVWCGEAPAFPRIPIGFSSILSIGSQLRQKSSKSTLYNCRSRATILFFMIFYQKLYHIFTNCVNHPKQNSSHFFHIQRNRLAFIFIILNFFHFHDMKPPYLPDIGGWTDATGEEGFLPVFRTPEHFPAP